MESKFAKLLSESDSLMNKVKPHAMQDFGQATDQLGDFQMVVSVQCLKSNFFQVRIGVVSDQIMVNDGMRDVSGMTFAGYRNEIKTWLEFTIPVFFGSLEAMKVGQIR